MDKRKETNRLVKESITEALFALMSAKNFSDITITEIIEKAGVARVSYYRNYKSKEQIIQDCVFDFIQVFKDKNVIHFHSKLTEEKVQAIFELVYGQKEQLKIIFNAGLSGLFLNSLNAYFEEINFGDKEIGPTKHEKKWIFYAACGGFFNIMAKWIMDDFKENPQEIIKSLIQGWNAIQSTEYKA